MRAFLAVPVPDPAAGEVRSLLHTLRHELPDVRWVSEESPHITVHFFGSIDESEAQRALLAVTPVLQTVRPFACTLDRLGSFPARGAPRVLWLGPSEPSRALIDVTRQCRAALAGAGFVVEEREYRPHCTLGRPRSAWDGATIARFRSLDEGECSITFTATCLTLFESQISPRGAVHIPRATLQMNGATQDEPDA